MSPSNSSPVTEPESIYGSRKAPLSLDIIVVGCGIGGLSAAFCLTQAGHRVTIVESAPVAGEDIGAGILTSPNSSRLLQRWGLREQLDRVAVRPHGAIIRKHDNGEQVGFTEWGETAQKNYGAPYYQIHRADLHKALYDLVSSRVTILLGSSVVGCDPNPASPSVTLESGKVLTADLVIGADGLKSYIQQVVLGKANRADPTGDAAYRALVPASLMKQDPELRELVENPHLTMWLAPGRNRLVGYPVRRGELYNLAMIHPDNGSIESWTSKGDVDEMRGEFSDYEPRVQKILGLVQSPLKYRLMDRKPLDKWTHDSGRVTLLGDACHPMLPYIAQGAAMAIEDAAVLGNLLSRISHISQLKSLLKGYEDLRLQRTAAAQAASRAQQRLIRPQEGGEQRGRNENTEAMANGVAGKTEELQHQSSANNEPSQNGRKNEVFFGYDADVEAEKWWGLTKKSLCSL